MRAFFAAALVALFVAWLPAPASSQELGLRAGPAWYNARYTGDGNGVVVGAYHTHPLGTYLMLEGSLPLFFSTGQRTEDDIVHDDLRALLPDIQLQIGVPGKIRPYAGVGVGLVIPLSESGFDFGPTASASLGLKMHTRGVIIGAELRARALRKSEESRRRESTREVTIGVGWPVGGH
jgi:hypothetical protein